MRKSLLHLSSLAVLLSLTSAAFAEPFLRLVQPYDNASIPSVKQSFVFGSVLPATAALTINGLPVTPYQNGGFLVMIPFEPGRFKIEAVADDGVSSTTVIRYVNVATDAAPLPENEKEIRPVAPSGRRVVRVGDTIELMFRGAPGGEARYKIAGMSDSLVMEETRPSVYKSVYTIKNGDKFDAADVNFSLKRKDGKKITAKAGAQVTVQRRETPRVVELKEDAVVLTGPDNDFGYNFFALQGVRFEVTGETNDFTRVAVGAANEGWVRKASLLEMPAGTPLPHSVSRNMRVWTNGSSTFVELPLQNHHLHHVEQTLDPHVLKLTLYGVTADTDRIRYASPDTIVKDITWFQPSPDAMTLEVRTSQELGWGYDVRYENGNTLVLEIRHKPEILPGKAPSPKLASLRGIRIALDAGHSVQSFGTIGPWANTEAAVNLAAAKVIKEELEKRGAEVVMIQDGTKELSLPDRTVAAWKARAQFFVSLHCDAVAEGTDPRENNGYSVHYFHPQSQAFAAALYKAYGSKTSIPDAGLWRSNLAVCRTPTMPAVLVEMGFLILPEEEEKLLSTKNQKALADAIASSVRDVVVRSGK